MSRLTIHTDRPDVGVLYTDLFVYDMTNPGTGGAVTALNPALLLDRETVIVETQDLKISLALNRRENLAEICLGKGKPAQETNRKKFDLSAAFQSEAPVVFNVLYHDWRITALINSDTLTQVKL